MAMHRTALVFACAACSSSPAPTLSPLAGPPAQLVAAPGHADDPVVARVNGRPVYGSCVQTQAARGATKQRALDECVDFELLAQAAERYATDREVVHATRTALVSQLIALDYEDKFTKPADFGPFYDRIIERNKQRVSHDEARASAYVRINVARDAPRADDDAARALVEEVAAAAASERGLTGFHLDELAKRVIGTRATYEYAAVPPFLHDGGLAPVYEEALFSIPEVGRTWPSALRTPWGWDVILFADVIPAEHLTPEQIADRFLPDVKRSYFTQWTQQVERTLGITPKLFDDNLPKLEDIE